MMDSPIYLGYTQLLFIQAATSVQNLYDGYAHCNIPLREPAIVDLSAALEIFGSKTSVHSILVGASLQTDNAALTEA